MVGEEISTTPSADPELVRKVAHQGKIVRELQELSMSMRTVPVQGVFQKMARLARDLSRKAGKSATGRVELRAFHQAGNIVIEIEDDGKGLDKDRILKKAIDNGVLRPSSFPPCRVAGR